jgi:hypothetical protein
MLVPCGNYTAAIPTAHISPMNSKRLSLLAGAALGLAVILPASGAAPGRPATIQARLLSCDSETVRAAAEAVLDDPATQREPAVLFQAALAERMAGRKEQAAFLYLAARLRMSRQALAGRDEARQALAALVVTISPLIMPDLLTDPALARWAVQRTADWDRSTPDPFRDVALAKGGAFPARLAEIDTAMARLPRDLQAKAGGGGAALLAEAERQLAAMRGARCRP